MMQKISFLFLILLSQFVMANTQTDSDLLFNWAEIQYPQYFSPSGQVSQTTDIWYYRHYPSTNNYLGVNTNTLDVYVLGDIFGGQTRVNSLQALMDSAGLNSAGADCPLKTDEDPISPGPYDHRVHVATSSDGLNFSSDGTTLLDHASAPDSVIGTDNSTWVYYVNGTPGQHAIFIAKIGETGMLEPFDCIRIDGEVDLQAVDPDVLQLSDGSYQLFFNPLVSPNPSAQEGIYTANSSDGIHFSNKSLIYQQAGALNPSGIQLANGSWLLTFTDENRTYVASSDDGKSYTVIKDFDPGIPELVYLSELNEVRLYTAELTGLVVRSSIDGGLNWSNLSASAPGAQDPSVLRLSPSSWFLYYRTESRENP